MKTDRESSNKSILGRSFVQMRTKSMYQVAETIFSQNSILLEYHGGLLQYIIGHNCNELLFFLEIVRTLYSQSISTDDFGDIYS